MTEKEEPTLYMVEPSGVYWVSFINKCLDRYQRLTTVYIKGYRGCAVGKGKSVAKTEIEKLDLENMTVREAVKQITRM
jgi:20S proteasome subunit alpha 7